MVEQEEGRDIWHPQQIIYGEEKKPAVTKVIIPAGQTKFLVLPVGLKLEKLWIDQNNLQGNFGDLGLGKNKGLIMFDAGTDDGRKDDLVRLENFLNGKADKPPVKGVLDLKNNKNYSGKTAGFAFAVLKMASS